MTVVIQTRDRRRERAVEGLSGKATNHLLPFESPVNAAFASEDLQLRD
jgi:hypothetical protein